MDKQEQTLLRHVQDMLRRAEAGAEPDFTGFLNSRQAGLIKRSLRREQQAYTLFFGGHPAEERVVFGVFPSYETPASSRFPIVSLQFQFRQQDKLSHRDFLGSILALGLSRDTLGDILVGEGLAVGFFSPPAADLITQQLAVVGRVGVAIQPYTGGELPQVQLEDMRLNVASRRLDCIVAAICKLSREKSAAMVQGGLVQVDGAVCMQTAYPLPEECIVSVRYYGRYKIGGEIRHTKKDRSCIACQRYI